MHDLARNSSELFRVSTAELRCTVTLYEQSHRQFSKDLKVAKSPNSLFPSLVSPNNLAPLAMATSTSDDWSTNGLEALQMRLSASLSPKDLIISSRVL